MAVARRDARTPTAPAPPARLRPVLRFADRTQAARATVRDVLDGDEAFRARVVAEEADALAGGSVDEASRWFLLRPDGWRADLDAAVDVAVAEEERAEGEREEASARRRVEQLEAAAERLRAERDEARAEAGRAVADLDGERARRRRAEADLAGRAQDLGRLREERATAVRQLGEARELAESRLAERRRADDAAASAREERDGWRDRAEQLAADLERASTDGAARAGAAAPSPAAPDPAAVARAVDRMAAAVAALSDELRAVSLGLVAAADGSGPSAGPGPAAAVPARAPRRAEARRTRPRLRHGAVDGTVEATRQYLSTPGAVVVVDGYNVSMTAWPALDKAPQRESLVACLTDLRRRYGPDVHVVFDGNDDGRRPAVGVPLDVRVHFSPAGTEADDVVLELVERLPADRPVVVVSSDRRVADGARERGAAVVGAPDLLELWRS